MMLSFYNHYDVQPADPIDEWDSDPWAAEIRDDRTYARGVADRYRDIHDKEPVIYATSQGSGAWYQLCAQFGIVACTAGVGRARSQAHAPNETIYVDDFILGIKHISAIMDRFAEHD